MKSSNEFKETILAYLEAEASTDDTIKRKMESEKFSIDDCISYILNTVKDSGVNGFTDDEIFGMAKHYTDECEHMEVKEMIDANVIVNHVVELTEEEIAEERAKAKRKVFDDAVAKMHKPKASPKKEEAGNQQTLF